MGDAPSVAEASQIQMPEIGKQGIGQVGQGLHGMCGDQQGQGAEPRQYVGVKDDDVAESKSDCRDGDGHGASDRVDYLGARG